jgi:hypothetical protein
MNPHQVESLVTLAVLAVLFYFLWRTRNRHWKPYSEAAMDCRSTRVLRPNERHEQYALKFRRDDESFLRRQADGINVQLRVAKHIRERPTVPRHRALVVIPQKAKSNVVQLPSGEPVQVEWRKSA